MWGSVWVSMYGGCGVIRISLVEGDPYISRGLLIEYSLKWEAHGKYKCLWVWFIRESSISKAFGHLVLT